MEVELMPEQMSQALVLMRRADIKMTGQNKVWLSGNVIFHSLHVRDADSIAMAGKSIQEELNVSEGKVFNLIGRIINTELNCNL
jgi:chondroitin AC lyase